MTPQTTILYTPVTNTFPTSPDLIELMKTTSEGYIALHTTILNKPKTNNTVACMELEQLTKGADTTTTKSVSLYKMIQKTQSLTL